jgi:hypothetical protein
MLGSLHIEMTLFKTLGGWLEDSGWTSATKEARIASAGTAQSFLKAKHVSSTRASSVQILHIAQMYRAYNEYADNQDNDAELLSLEIRQNI